MERKKQTMEASKEIKENDPNFENSEIAFLMRD